MVKKTVDKIFEDFLGILEKCWRYVAEVVCCRWVKFEEK